MDNFFHLETCSSSAYYIPQTLLFQQLLQLFLFNLFCKLISSCNPLNVTISYRFGSFLTYFLQTLLVLSFNLWRQLPLKYQEYSKFFPRQTSSSTTHVECLPLPAAHSGLTTPLLEHLLNEYISVYTGQLEPVHYAAVCPQCSPWYLACDRGSPFAQLLTGIGAGIGGGSTATLHIHLLGHSASVWWIHYGTVR